MMNEEKKFCCFFLNSPQNQRKDYAESFFWNKVRPLMIFDLRDFQLNVII